MSPHPASYWRARSTDSEHINLLSLRWILTEIWFLNFSKNLVRKYPELPKIYVFAIFGKFPELSSKTRSAHARTEVTSRFKMAAPIETKWRPPWSRSNFVSAAAILEFRPNFDSEIRGSISQPLEPLQPKSWYIQNLWTSPILMHPNLSTLDKYWAS